MSNLYIRVRTNFFTHRKTAKLRAMIGDAAYWLPLRLWAYAAENQPDGDMSGYSDEELGMLIGCLSNAPSNASSMVQALKVVGYIDEAGMIHDWEEHNGYHANFSERAKKAAAARWSKSPPAPPSTEKQERGNRKEDISIARSNACSIAQASLPGVEIKPTVTAEEIYNEYPRKVGKPVALAAIKRAMGKTAPDALLAFTKAYSATVKGTDTRIPNPSTWFNQERFNDAPDTWIYKPTALAGRQPISRNTGTMNEGAKYDLKLVAASKARQAAEAAAKLATNPLPSPATPL